MIRHCRLCCSAKQICSSMQAAPPLPAAAISMRHATQADCIKAIERLPRNQTASTGSSNDLVHRLLARVSDANTGNVDKVIATALYAAAP